MKMISRADLGYPEWIPKRAQLYLRHIEEGVPIRALARSEGVHASTILRTVRAYENRRDDPLIDEALSVLGQAVPATGLQARMNATESGSGMAPSEGVDQVNNRANPAVTVADEVTLQAEARRILGRMSEPGTLLAVAPKMEKAVVLKGTLRVAVVGREYAQAFALQDWIAVKKSGRVTTYEITNAGRTALKRWLAADGGTGHGPGLAEAMQPYAAPERYRGGREAAPASRDDDDAQARRARYNAAESPLGVLARRRDKDGNAFLGHDEVVAGERLREDFELAQMGTRVAQNWDRFLTSGVQASPSHGMTQGSGSSAARDRVALALRELGPGLGDMVLRCCCYLEGLETAEQRMGWSARSGKIVLRIALMRLSRHYLETYGRFGPKIG